MNTSKSLDSILDNFEAGWPDKNGEVGSYTDAKLKAKQAIVEAVEGLIQQSVSPETAEMHRFIDEEKLRQAIKEWQ